MKKLLTVCGYNSTWSFKSITEENLSDIEKYIEKHHRKMADEFEEYVHIKPFEFLPGHRAMIFGIKSEIDDFKKEDNKRPKKNVKSKPVLKESDTQIALLNQMSAFTKGLKLQADWSNSIKDSSFTATETALFGTCTILCPICSSSFIVRYDKHWKTSNICKHIRKHSQSNESASQNDMFYETIYVSKETGHDNVEIYGEVQEEDSGEAYIDFDELDDEQ